MDIPKETIDYVNSILKPFGVEFNPSTQAAECRTINMKQAIAYTNLSYDTIHNLVLSGKVIGYKYGPSMQSGTLIEKKSLDDYLDSLKSQRRRKFPAVPRGRKAVCA